MRKLYKDSSKKKLTGVCAGLSEYFNIDPSIVRVVTVVIAFAWGLGLVAYIAAAIILPDKSTIM